MNGAEPNSLTLRNSVISILNRSHRRPSWAIVLPLPVLPAPSRVEMLRVLERRNFPVDELILLASSRSAGKK